MEQQGEIKENPVQPTPAPTPAEQGTKSKAGLLTTILLLVLAAGGIAFGVYGMILANQPHKCPAVNNTAEENIIEVTCPDGTVTKVEKIIDNDLAQNLINPYMGTFNFLSNLLDYPFDDNSKMEVAWHNLSVYNSFVSGSDYIVSYDEINAKYQELFGSSKSLEKKDYATGHSDQFKYSDNAFRVWLYAGGGGGVGMFNVVKNASYSGENIIVEVYHDVISMCYIGDSDYCIDATDNVISATITSADEYNMQDLINNFSDQIPVYTMTFAKDNGHYVLTNVEKQ